jgi:hypothetical protein
MTFWTQLRDGGGGHRRRTSWADACLAALVRLGLHLLSSPTYSAAAGCKKYKVGFRARWTKCAQACSHPRADPTCPSGTIACLDPQAFLAVSLA